MGSAFRVSKEAYTNDWYFWPYSQTFSTASTITVNLSWYEFSGDDKPNMTHECRVALLNGVDSKDERRCGLTFETSRELLVHITHNHQLNGALPVDNGMGGYRYRCDRCGSTSGFWLGMAKHLMDHGLRQQFPNYKTNTINQETNEMIPSKRDVDLTKQAVLDRLASLREEVDAKFTTEETDLQNRIEVATNVGRAGAMIQYWTQVEALADAGKVLHVSRDGSIEMTQGNSDDKPTLPGWDDIENLKKRLTNKQRERQGYLDRIDARVAFITAADGDTVVMTEEQWLDMTVDQFLSNPSWD